MRKPTFDTLLGQLERLSPGQRDEVLQAMHAIGRKEQVAATIDTARAGRLCCPRCHCHERHRHSAPTVSCPCAASAVGIFNT